MTAEVPLAHRLALVLAVFELTAGKIGLGEAHAVAIMAVKRLADEGRAHGVFAHPGIVGWRPSRGLRQGRTDKETGQRAGKGDARGYIGNRGHRVGSTPHGLREMRRSRPR